MSTFGLKGFASGIVLDIGTTYFDEPQVLTFGAGDILYSHVKLSRAFEWVNVSVQYENTSLAPFGASRGLDVFSVGASKSASFFKGLVTASTSLALAYNTEAFGLDSGLYLRGSAELGWKLTKHLTMILPSVNYSAPLTVHDGRSLDGVVSAGFGYRF